MNPESVTALVLSAGFSERMGDFKPLMMLGGMTILERVIRLFQTIGVRRIHVVVGHRAAELTALIDRWGARSVVNVCYAEGMFSSVVAGVSSLDEGTGSFFVLPVDIPLVRPATLRDLLQAFPAAAAAICHPTFRGRRGHPPLIGSHHIRSILEWREEGGLGALLTRLEQHAVNVAVVDEFIHQDMDRAEDYRRMAGRLESREIFSPAECAALLNDRVYVPPAVPAHGRAVAEMAMRIGQALNHAGFSLNLRLICAAALVHDVARGGPDHARRGGKLLRDLDMPLLAEIVETHMDMAVGVGRQIKEAEVVFLADKLVQEDRFVGLAERFRLRMRDSSADSREHDSARRRLDAARKIAERIEAVIGRSLESLRDGSRVADTI
ncbi:MAG: NTP transferase domain-containing protein [Deltaproteobacteria bacterium]|nr:NTP transferase domain-containing protein [Deltaproteobacteria bacterium]